MSEAELTTQRMHFLMDLEGMDEPALRNLDAALASHGDSESRIRQAFLALRRDDMASAQAQLERSGAPADEPFAAMARASLCAQQGHFEDALVFANHAAQLPYVRGDALLVRAVALSNLGRFDEVLATLGEDALEDRTQGSLLAIKAFALQGLGDGARARELILSAHRFLPDLVGFSEQLTALRDSARPGAPRCVRI